MIGKDDELYSVRAATADDLDFLYHLVRMTMRDHVVATWVEWDETWQHNRFTQKFAPENWQILLVGEHWVGGVCVESRSTEMFLANLHLLPEWQGRGIGTAVVRTLVTAASEQGKQAITLSVLRSNCDAKRFYERFGFCTVDADEFRHVMSLALLPGQDITDSLA